MSIPSALKNIRLLYLFRVFSSSMVAIPVMVPFFQQNGLSQAEIFLSQSAFAAAILLFEIPSGYFADRFGRRKSLLLGACLWTFGFALYSLSYGFGPIVACEVLLGVAISFISGADSALAFDSLVSANRRSEYRSFEARSLGLTGAAEATASIAGGLIALISLRATLVADVFLAAPMILIAWRLTEPRRHVASSKNALRDVLSVVKYSLHGHREIKWLIIYAAVVGTTTHTAVWLIQPYFQQVGVPLGWFGVLWAALMVSMFWFSRFAVNYERGLGKGRALASFVVLGAVTYVGLGLHVAFWALPLVLGFYFIRAVYTPILRDYLNDLVESDIRATVLSVQSFAQRALYIGAGPLIGWVMDVYSLSTALLFSAAFYGVLGAFALLMMKRAKLL